MYGVLKVELRLIKNKSIWVSAVGWREEEWNSESLGYKCMTQSVEAAFEAEVNFWVQDWKGWNVEVLKLVDMCVNKSCLEHTLNYLKYFKSIDVQNTNYFSLALLFHLIKETLTVIWWKQ